MSIQGRDPGLIHCNGHPTQWPPQPGSVDKLYHHFGALRNPFRANDLKGPRFLRREREPIQPQPRDEEYSTEVVATIAEGYAEGQEMNPTGMIRLPLRFDDKVKARNLEVDFLVVDVPTTYNIILGRSTLHKAGSGVPAVIRFQDLAQPWNNAILSAGLAVRKFLWDARAPPRASPPACEAALAAVGASSVRRKPGVRTPAD
ncbi:hypothetical protein Cgig2_026417 [Carnegiea gigantea]|uniref:Uncharacterized protein n=1 Tax=Carnegiea gigantea TaxID=171969 RepID=A0A9Q1GPD5_9CARY|nr:hypothetical protein Cgig2_026417 [Carnegiea gigantea]